MFCSQCGTANADSNRFCTRCGNPLAQAANDQASPGNPASAPGSAGAAQGTVYAGIGSRIGALLIDTLIVTLAGVVIGVIVGLLSPPGGAVDGLLSLASIAGAWLYTALLESGPRQATVGKMAVGIKVTGLDGNRISFGRATGRYFAEMLSSLSLGIGYVIAAFTQRRQALHDLIAGSLVVDVSASPDQVAASGRAPPTRGWAVALIVLACFVPIAGILAAIAIPAYQDYTIRAQVSEGLMAAGDVKAGVAEFVAQTGQWPADNVEAGLGSSAETAAIAGRYFEAIDVSDGTIYITYGGDANSRIQGRVLALRPFISGEGDVVWQCGNAGDPPDASSNSAGSSGGGIESSPGGSDIADKHIPASCRTGFVGT
jgi:uncharacterized RDD family membrane protein YckC/Tfp pilus assembly major pilin PilA